MLSTSPAKTASSPLPKVSLLLQAFLEDPVEFFGHTLLQIQNWAATSSPDVGVFYPADKPHVHATVGEKPEQNTVRSTRAIDGKYYAFALDDEIQNELLKILACAPVLDARHPELNMPYNTGSRQQQTLYAFMHAAAINHSAEVIDPKKFYKLLDDQFYVLPEYSPNETTRMLGLFHGGLFRAIYFAIHHWLDEGFRCTGFAITCIQAAYLRTRGFLTDHGLDERSTLAEIARVVKQFALMTEAERLLVMNKYLPRDLQIDAGILKPSLLFDHFKMQATLSVHNCQTLILSSDLDSEGKPCIKVESQTNEFTHHAAFTPKPKTTFEGKRAWIAAQDSGTPGLPFILAHPPTLETRLRKAHPAKDLNPHVPSSGAPESAIKATQVTTEETATATAATREAAVVSTKYSWCCPFRAASRAATVVPLNASLT